ncbi:hypothetical protein T484DRAFT_1887903 [Baffinella frigidus]|nr:hypothetical protein T484DRAFT_1887903 [Cryptophyta sp. CCMP2293]
MPDRNKIRTCQWTTLTARDSSGRRVGLYYFTDPKLIAAGSIMSRLWRFLILVMSTAIFVALYGANVYDLDRLHGLLHVIRAINALNRLFHMQDEITQKLKGVYTDRKGRLGEKSLETVKAITMLRQATVSQNKRRFVDRRPPTEARFMSSKGKGAC